MTKLIFLFVFAIAINVQAKKNDFSLHESRYSFNESCQSNEFVKPNQCISVNAHLIKLMFNQRCDSVKKLTVNKSEFTVTDKVKGT